MLSWIDSRRECLRRAAQRAPGKDMHLGGTVVMPIPVGSRATSTAGERQYRRDRQHRENRKERTI
jgi:hypothetical protein